MKYSEFLVTMVGSKELEHEFLSISKCFKCLQTLTYQDDVEYATRVSTIDSIINTKLRFLYHSGCYNFIYNKK